MTFLLARRGFLGVLSGLIAAPLVARAGVLDLVRAPALALNTEGILAPKFAPQAIETTLSASGDLNYSYWVSFCGTLRRMTAAEIIDAPPGVVQPWLSGVNGDLRPMIERERGALQLPDGTFAARWDRRTPEDAPLVSPRDFERIALQTERRELMRQIDLEKSRIAAGLERRRLAEEYKQTMLVRFPNAPRKGV